MSKFTGTIHNYKSSLFKVFIIHIIMFLIEFTAAVLAKSTSVLADSLDFIGDAANYAVSFYVISFGVLFRAYVSIAKAITMLTLGVPVIAYAITRLTEGTVPNSEIMNIAGVLGIVAHIICIYYLYPFRNGDSNQLSVWICTINDLIGNILTVMASFFVLYTNSIIPDIISAIIIVGLAILGAFLILRSSIKEIKEYKNNHRYANARIKS